MSQDRLNGQAVVETIFEKKDARRAEMFQRAIQNAAFSAGGLGAGSEGRGMAKNSLTFVMDASKISAFVGLVASNCSRLRPAPDELQTKVSVRFN